MTTTTTAGASASAQPTPVSDLLTPALAALAPTLALIPVAGPILALILGGAAGLAPIIERAIADHNRAVEEVKAEMYAELDKLIPALVALRDDRAASDKAAIDAEIAGMPAKPAVTPAAPLPTTTG